jgi:prevent-host-death family protein
VGLAVVSPIPTVNISDARRHLSALVHAIESGAEAEIIIARNGKPAAKLMPVTALKCTGVRIGLVEGRYPPMSLADFNARDEEITALFYREDDEAF